MEAAIARSYPAKIEATLFDLVLIREKIATRQEQLAEINDLLLLAERLNPDAGLDRFEDLTR